MDFKNMNNKELVLSFEKSVASERKMTAEIIRYIAEIDRRRLFIEKGFTSLFDYLTREIGYSPGSAMRRIDAARLLQEMPEVIVKFENGDITLSQATQVQKASRDQKRIKNTHLTPHDNRELFTQIEKLSQKETEQIIAHRLNIPVPKYEKELLHKDNSVTLTLTLTQEQMVILEKAQDMIAHTGANANWADTLTYLAKKELARRTHIRSPKNPKRAPKSTAVAEVNDGIASETSETIRSKRDPTPQALRRRYISQTIRKKLLHPNAVCAYKDQNGKSCDNRRFLQLDHIQSWSRGGNNTVDNLQVLCGVHNRLKYRSEMAINLKGLKT
ncbi:MAG: HNH endonuclease [Bdellovibrionales bacterium]|nr:HNH endonuclease [Bdellovibrionales bacterium]